jgi:subtilisin family serine protease
MRKKFSLLVMGLVLVLFSYSFAQIPIQQSPRAGVDYVVDQLIIKFKSQIEEGQKRAVTSSLNSVTLKKFSIIGAELVQISGMTVEEAINLLKDDPRIEYAEPNYIFQLDAVPNDPYFNNLWGMQNTGQTWGTPDADIDAEKAWDISTGDSVIVGVIDTGVDTAHVDLMGNIWTNPGEIPNNGIDDDGNGYVDDVHGWDFVNNNNNPNDIDGHGSHVSGTIAAKGNNGIGVVGVCWSAKIMPLKICEYNSCYTSSAIEALEYATKMGAKLTSNSYRLSYPPQSLKNAIDSSGAHGMLFIAAAGNYRENNDVSPLYPASYNSENIIAVAATDHNDNLADEPGWGSNYGLTTVDLAAPGVNILSTVPPAVYGSDYAYFSGTSMATPHVSGTAALIWSKYPTLTHLQVKERIMNSVDPLPSLAGKCVTGGRLNAYRAIAEPDSIPPSTVTDLAVIQTGGQKITLSWTATGDDSSTGTAHSYDVRYSLVSIDNSNFNLATQVIGEPEPKPAGLPETLLVTGLNFNTPYYFAIKAFDEWNHPSGISNSPLGTTLGPPDIAFTPGSLIDSLFPNDTSTKILAINNNGLSDLSLKIFIDKTPSLFTLSQRRIPELKIDPSRIRTDFSGSISSISGDKPLARNVKPEDIVKVYTPSKPGKLTVTSNIAVLGADGQYGEVSLNNNVAQYLVNSGKFASVTTMNGCYFTPTLSELQMFDGVLVFGWYNWDNPTAIGNVLADFVDNSGRLMVAVAANATGGDWQIKGRFNTQNYWLISPNGGDFAGPYLMGTVHHPEHPIMSGVSSVVSGCKFSSSATVSPGTVRLADFTDGTPLLVIKEQIGNRRVDISFPVITKRVNPQYGIDTTSDAELLIVNALDWLTNYWLSANPRTLVIPAGNNSNIYIAFDATNLENPNYDAELVLSSNDPDENPVRVPVNLKVAGRGDPNADFKVNVTDVIYLVNYFFKGGPVPIPGLFAADVNCDNLRNVTDVIYLVNYLFKGGPKPGC